MKYPKLLSDYGRYSDAILAQKAANVKTALTDNSNFTTTTPTLAEFDALRIAFDQAVSKTLSGDRVFIAAKNLARNTLALAMRQLALNIEGQANADKGKLLSSGFDLAATGDNALTIKTPADFKLLEGLNHGELKLSCKRDAAAVSYLYEYIDEIPTETTKWVAYVSSSREHILRGLPSGKRIYCRVTINGRRGQSAISEVLNRMVQ